MKILFADDDEDLLDVTSYALRKHGYHVVTATDGPRAVQAWQTEQPGLVLLDVGLPRLNGFEVCRTIRESSRVPIVMVTARSDDDSVVQGFLAGADDYVTKPFSHRALVARLRAILSRTGESMAPEPDGRLQTGSLFLDFQSHEVIKGDAMVHLTPTEFRILYILAANEGHVVTADRLVEYAWGFEHGDRELLKTHVSHIRRKLGFRPGEPGYIRVAPWVGYSLIRAPQSTNGMPAFTQQAAAAALP